MRTSINLTSIAAATLLAGAAHAEALDPIVVTANNLEQPLSTVTSPTYVISRDEIDEKGWESVAEVLQHLPGISISNNGGLGKATNIYVRGQNGNGILFMIDGQMVAAPSNITLSPQIENLPLSNVERIEVVEGPQSGIWGANASGGVINIITRGAQTSSFTLKAGSENTRGFSASLGKVFKGGDLSIHAATLGTDGFTAIKPYGTSGTGFEEDGYNQTDIGFKAGINGGEHHRFEIQLDQTQAAASFDSTFPYDPNSTADRNERTITNKAASYQYKNGTLFAGLKLSEYTIDRTSYSAWGAYRYKGQITTHEGQIGYGYAQNGTVSVAAGNQRLQGSQDAYWHDWVGLTHVHKLGAISLVEAIRYDHYDRFDEATTGKLGVNIPLFDSLTLKANYGTAYNAPSAFQVGYGTTSNLKPESSEGWDITLAGWGAEITYFDQQTKDAIVYGGIWPNDYYYNAPGTTTYKGWIFSYQRGFGDWHIGLNNTWLEARNDQGQLLARRPLQEGSLMIDYYGLDRLHLGTVIRHVGDYYDTNGTSGANLGNYTVVDATINYTLNRHFTAFAKAINLFDEDYYLAADQKNPPDYGYNTGGFQWRIGLRGKF